MKAILNSKKILFAILAAVLFSACFMSLPTEAEACYSCKPCYYYVTYCPNGGTPNKAVQDSYYYCYTYKIRQNTMFTRTGYTFDGWNTRADGKGTKYPVGLVIKCTSLTLYAQWKSTPKITATYYPNGGTGATIIESVIPNTNYTIRQNSFTRVNYIFSGWNTNAAGTGANYSPAQVIRLTSSIVLYAKWVACTPQYKITYYPNGGTGSNIVDSANQSVRYTIRQNTFTRANYIFSGWNTNAAGTGANYTAGQIITVTGNLNLYAKWTKCPTQYKITYNPNGGVGLNIVDTATAGATYTIRNNTYTRAGYTFTGWNTNANGPGTNYTAGQRITVNSSLTLYAQWKSTTPTKRTITYYPNGGTGSTITDSVTAGATYTIRSNTYTRAGYIFNGWNTNANGTGTSYTAGQRITVNSNTVLYAQWIKCPTNYSITYNPNGGTGSSITDTAIAGATYTIRNNTYTRAGYTFNGWNTNAAGTGTSYTAGQRITVNSSITLYAKWTQTTARNTITYNPNGATGSIITDAVNQGTSYALRPASTYTRTGYTLVWNTNAAGTGTTYTPGQVITVTTNLTLYAKWTQTTTQTYTITYYPNGGRGSAVTDTVIRGNSYTIRQSMFERPGYTFLNWSTTTNNGIRYYPGNIITPTGNMVLYVIWRPGY